jgi:hypothetical protein
VIQKLTQDLQGVVLSHGSIIESAIGSRNVFGFLDGRVLQFSNYMFDVSVWVSLPSASSRVRSYI